MSSHLKNKNFSFYFLLFNYINMFISFKRKFDKLHYWKIIKFNLKKLESTSELIIYDIGANKGEWSKAALRNLSVSKIYAFEPLREMRKYFISKKIEVFSELLSNNFDTIDFHYSTNYDGSTGSSIYPENTAFGSMMQVEQRNTVTLDSIIARNNLPYPSLIKIDVQGAELKVLEGSQKCLSFVHFIICELPIAEYNIGAPTTSEYFDYFEKLGFLPIEIIEQHFSQDRLLQFDVLFRKK
jgi:FkbM family methyltransferase